MKVAFLPGAPPVEIALRRSAKARRYSLRISGLDGRVTLTIPRHGNRAEALAFAWSRAEWIRKTLADHEPPVAIEPGAILPVSGHSRVVTPAAVRSTRIVGDSLLVPQEKRRVAIQVETFLKAMARTALSEASVRYARALNRPFGRITLRDTRSRWGSCSAKGDLMYSWRLIMAPSEVLDYVAAHEVAHLVEMNHSREFWGLVERLCPDYRERRAWLRQAGSALHRYRFRD